MTPREQFNSVYLSAHRNNAHSKWLADAAEIPESAIQVNLDGQGKPVAALLALPVKFAYQQGLLDASVMKYVTTRPEARARGAATHLVATTLEAARSRGEALCVIVPPRRHLFFFYDRFSFATVLYVDELRYTSMHRFEGGEGDLVEPSGEILRGLQLRYGCGPVFSDEDFERMRDEFSTLPNPHILAAAAGDERGILFATEVDNNVHVRMLLADNEQLRLTMLHELRRLEPQKTFVVDTPPLSGDRNYLRSRGMVRIVNPKPMFDAMAARHPGLKYVFRITGGLLPENNGCYRIADGRCERLDSVAERPDLDVNIATLASILFSSSKMGEIFNLPTRRPM